MMWFWYGIANSSFVAPLLLIAGTALILYTSARVADVEIGACEPSSADAGRQSPARRQLIAARGMAPWF
jgi:hypothetical protein